MKHQSLLCLLKLTLGWKLEAFPNCSRHCVVFVSLCLFDEVTKNGKKKHPHVSLTLTFTPSHSSYNYLSLIVYIILIVQKKQQNCDN